MNTYLSNLFPVRDLYQIRLNKHTNRRDTALLYPYTELLYPYKYHLQSTGFDIPENKISQA
jgi:hypothetical protein